MRTKSAILNAISDILPQIIISILGLIKIKLFLDVLGSEQVGLYQLYTQIFAYLILAEGGVGSAVLFKLYKPVYDNDKQKVDAILCGAKKIFRIIITIMIVFGIIIAFNIGLLMKEQVFSSSFLFITFIVFLMSQMANYFVIPERLLFDARQQKYIPNTIFQTISVIRTIGEIVIVLLLGKLMYILISLLVFNSIGNVILLIVFKKHYGKIDKNVKPDTSMLKDVKHLFVNTIGTVVSNNIDVLIISKCIGLSSVVIYTSYNYICSTIVAMVEKITGATMSGVANIIIESKEKALSVIREYNSFTFYIATVLGVPLMYALNPFIRIFYDGKISTSKVIAALFVFILIYQIVKIPLKTYTFAAGKFQKIKKYVIFECITNLTLSIVLAIKFGIIGVLIGTIVSLLICDYYPKSKVVFKEILGTTVKAYHLNNLKLFIFIGVMFTISYLLPCEYSSLLKWFIYSSLLFIINLLLTTLYYYFTNNLSFRNRIKLKMFRKDRV